jgi:hypothetical protein
MFVGLYNFQEIFPYYLLDKMDTGTTIGYLVGVLVVGAIAVIGLSYLGFFTVSLNLLIYCVYAVLFGLGTSMYFFNNGMTLSGILFMILALTVFIFFGMRWFSTESALNPPSTYTWPPNINTCPDYLYFYKRRGQDTCVDPLGVSKNGVIQKLPPGPINDDNDNYFFSLKTSASSNNPDAIQSELCQRAIASGLTWEGVTDGSVCISRQYGTPSYKSTMEPGAKTCQ